MLNRKICLITVLFLIICQIHPVYGKALANNAQSAILIDAHNQQVLYKKNETKKLYPASTTKIMTMILLFEAIKAKRIHWDDELSCSSYAASMGGSQVYLEENEKMSVEELFKCVAIASANDAATLLGEGIAGSHQEFVKMMNQKAKELHLVNTHFENCTGLQDVNHYTCSKDLAIMGAYLIKIGGQKLLSVTSMYDSYIREKGNQKFWLVNTNKLLKQYQGVDGLKTGYTKEAGYCIVTTCKKNGLRLIGVLMNEEKSQTRNEDMKELLNYGYSKYQQKRLYKKGEVIDCINVKGFVNQKVRVIVGEDICYLDDRTNHQKIDTKIKYNKIQLPISKEKEIGELIIKQGNKKIASYQVYLEKDVENMNFIKKLVRVYKSLI